MKTIGLTCSFCGRPFDINVSDDSNPDTFDFPIVWCDKIECNNKAEASGLLDISDNEATDMLDNLGLIR